MSRYFDPTRPVTFDEQVAFAISTGRANAAEALDQYTGPDFDDLEHAVGSYWDNYCDTMVEYGITRKNRAWRKGAEAFDAVINGATR